MSHGVRGSARAYGIVQNEMPLRACDPPAMRSGLSGLRECLPEPVGVNPPEVVLLAVDEGDGDLLAVGVDQLGRGGDVDLVVRRAELVADHLDDPAGVVAEVATGLAVQGDPRTHVTPGGRVRAGARWRAAGPSAPCR